MNKMAIAAVTLCVSAQTTLLTDYQNSNQATNAFPYYFGNAFINENYVIIGRSQETNCSSATNYMTKQLSNCESEISDECDVFEINSFKCNGTEIYIQPLQFALTFDDGIIFADNEELDIHACASTYSILKENINEELSFIYTFYLSKPENELTSHACELKQRFKKILRGNQCLL